MLHYLRSRFFRERFDLNCKTEILLLFCCCVFCLHARKKEKGFFLPLIANILLVSVFVTFYRPNELPKIKLFNDL